MKKELDAALCAKYPLIFKDRRGDARRTLMCWGFECGDGWYDLLDSTCALIYGPYEQAVTAYTNARQQEGTAPWRGAAVISAVDVERKRLKMKEAAEAIPVAVQVKQKFGTLRFYTNGGSCEAQAYIDFAAYHSGKVCETCGAPGTVRDSGWVRVSCDAHA